MCKVSRWLAPVAIAAVLSAITASGALANTLPAQVTKACQHSGIMSVCSEGGHYAYFGHRRVFILKHRIQAHAANTGWQTLMNHGDGLCMSQFNNLTLQQCNNSYNQQVNVGFGFNAGWFLQFHNGCANLRYASYYNNNFFIIYPCNGALNESFVINRNSASNVVGWNPPGLTFNVMQSELQGVGLASGYCATSDGVIGPGDHVYLWGCNWSANQTWGNANA